MEVPATSSSSSDVASVKRMKTSETAVEMTEIIDATTSTVSGVVSGGQIMKWMDLCACMAAEKFAESNCVTAAMDDLQFLCSFKLGDVVTLRGQVNRAFNSSMEVGVRVEVEDLLANKTTHACSAYFTFVPLLKNNKKILVPSSEEDERRFAEANERRQIRLRRRDTIQGVVESRVALSSSSSESAEFLNGLLPKKASTSLTLMTELVLPVHANHMETMFGGQAMAWMESCAFISATRFARKQLQLTSVDDIHFFQKIKVGNRVVVTAKVCRSFKKTLDVGVRMEKLSLDGVTEHALDAYMTFSVVKEEPIPPLLPETEEEKKQYEEAMGRRRIRLERKTIRNFGQELSPVWRLEDKGSQLQLIYSNIRSLMMVFNKSVFAQGEWETVSNENGVTVSLQQASNFSSSTTNLKVTCVKVETEIELSEKLQASQVFEFALDFSKRSEWDLVFDSGTVVHKIDDKNDIVHIVFKAKPPAQKRDFCMLRSWRVNDQHTEFIVSNRSVSFAAVPVTENYVRGEVLSSGWVMRVTSRDGKKFMHVTYILQLGTKALTLALGDIVGDSKVIAMSIANVQKLFATMR